jgi:hypothetical protein
MNTIDSQDTTMNVDSLYLDLENKELKDYIQHVYNIGYANGLTENFRQWNDVISKNFGNCAKSVSEIYKKILSSDEIKIKYVLYSFDIYAAEIDILVVLCENEFELIYSTINNENIFYKDIIGSKLGVNINIRCMSDAMFDIKTTVSDYPYKV